MAACMFSTCMQAFERPPSHSELNVDCKNFMMCSSFRLATEKHTSADLWERPRRQDALQVGVQAHDGGAEAAVPHGRHLPKRRAHAAAHCWRCCIISLVAKSHKQGMLEGTADILLRFGASQCGCYNVHALGTCGGRRAHSRRSTPACPPSRTWSRRHHAALREATCRPSMQCLTHA